MMRGHGGPLAHAASSEAEKPKNPNAAATRLWAYVRPFQRDLAWVMVLVVINAACQALWPFMIGRAIDLYVKPGGDIAASTRGLTISMAVLAVVFVVIFLTGRSQIVAMSIVSQKTLVSLRRDIFDKVQHIPLGYFDKNPVGDVMSRLVNDTDTINTFLGMGLVQVLGSIFALVGTLIAMVLQNWELALLSWTVIPILLFATDRFSKLARNAYRRTRRTIGDVSSELQEEIAGVKVAQAFNRTGATQRRFSERNAANRSANMSATAVTSAFTPLVDLLSVVATGIVAGFGGWLVTRDAIGIGTVVAFLAYVQTMFRPLQQLGSIYTQLQGALAGGERIFDLIDGPDEEERCPDCELAPIHGQVDFKAVSFAYDPEKPVLRDVSFTALAGQTIAVVGPTGAGKTTIINLLSRFYEPTAGEIAVDGQDVRSVTRNSLRRQMGAVAQDSFLFSASIADNIRYGRLEATDVDVVQAARAAEAHEFISRLKDGYQTVLGERGGGLSQGQRQLIAIARAILANPRILILDEATSSVDTYTESLIQRALHALLQGRTSFVIAHRLSTIRDANLVLVVNGGQIVERGTHDDLLALNGLYADLYRRQFREPVTWAVPAAP